MIYIDGLILSSCNECIKMIDSQRGSILLSEFEIDALHCNFPEVSVRWHNMAIVQIPAHPFKLTVTEKDVVILELEECMFELPKEMAMIINDDEMVRVSFEGQGRDRFEPRDICSNY